MRWNVWVAGAIALLAFPIATLAVADGCAIVTTTPDGYVSLRAGPGAAHKEIMRIRSGQFVGIDDTQGDPQRRWMRVTGLMKRLPDGGLQTLTTTEGWAYARYLHGIACD